MPEKTMSSTEAWDAVFKRLANADPAVLNDGEIQKESLRCDVIYQDKLFPKGNDLEDMNFLAQLHFQISGEMKKSEGALEEYQTCHDEWQRKFDINNLAHAVARFAVAHNDKHDVGNVTAEEIDKAFAEAKTRFASIFPKASAQAEAELNTDEMGESAAQLAAEAEEIERFNFLCEKNPLFLDDKEKGRCLQERR